MIAPEYVQHIDFDHLTVMPDTFIATSFRHLMTDLLLRAPMLGTLGEDDRQDAGTLHGEWIDPLRPELKFGAFLYGPGPRGLAPHVGAPGPRGKGDEERSAFASAGAIAWRGVVGTRKADGFVSRSNMCGQPFVR